jgi:hypothetical protein
MLLSLEHGDLLERQIFYGERSITFFPMQRLNIRKNVEDTVMTGVRFRREFRFL